MNKPKKPGTLEEFPLGKFHGQVEFSVEVSSRSAFAGFDAHTRLPCLHLCVVATSGVDWDGWNVRELGLIHGVTGVVEQRMREIVSHFFGETLDFADAMWRFEINSREATDTLPPHAHLLIGHKELFSGDAFLVRKSTSSALKRSALIKVSKNDERTAKAQASLRAFITSESTQ
ncbi:MAG: hypothetical protein WAW13_00170 [Minisyncoccia bacterium]